MITCRGRTDWVKKASEKELVVIKNTEEVWCLRGKLRK